MQAVSLNPSCHAPRIAPFVSSSHDHLLDLSTISRFSSTDPIHRLCHSTSNPTLFSSLADVQVDLIGWAATRALSMVMYGRDLHWQSSGKELGRRREGGRAGSNRERVSASLPACTSKGPIGAERWREERPTYSPTQLGVRFKASLYRLAIMRRQGFNHRALVEC